MSIDDGSGRTSTAEPRWLPEPAVRGLGLLAATIGVLYLAWRIGWTLNTSALWLALPLLVAEAHGHLTFLLNLFVTWHLTPAVPSPADERATVDFFIPTYNEPFEVLALTIAGAVGVTHPHTTHVLDDGRRPWVR